MNVVPFTEPVVRGRVFGAMTLNRSTGQWLVTGLEPHVAMKLKSVFPRISKTETKVFSFPNRPETCADLEWFTQRYPLAISEADRKSLRSGKRSFEWDRDDFEIVLGEGW